MPYITCKDGNTYSRYDTSSYVKKCICEEEQYFKEQRVKCDNDPNCVKLREQQMMVVSITLVCFIVVIALTIRKIIGKI